MAEVKKTNVVKTSTTPNEKKSEPKTVKKVGVEANKTVAKPEVKKSTKSTAKKVASKSDKQIKVTLIKSTNKCVIGMKKTVEALGLHRIGETKIHNDNSAIRGAIFKVKHLVKVEEVNGKEAK